MKTHLEALKEKVTVLKGSAKAVVERKIMELETAQEAPTVAVTLTDTIERSVSLAEELELAIANLENRLNSVLPEIATLLPSQQISNAPTAINRALEVNKTLKNSISRVNAIIEHIRL